MYVAPYQLGRDPIYIGGGPAVHIGDGAGALAVPPTLFQAGTSKEISIVSIARFAEAGVVRQIVSMDRNFDAARRWQWRLAAGNMEFIKTVGTVESVSGPHGIAAGQAAMFGVEVTSAGAVRGYVNGTLVMTGSVEPAEYSAPTASTIRMMIGRREELEARDATFSDTALFDRALGPTVHAQLAAAARLTPP